MHDLRAAAESRSEASGPLLDVPCAYPIETGIGVQGVQQLAEGPPSDVSLG